MRDEPLQYVLPHAFDWGVFKTYGWGILFVSALLYLTAFGACVLLVRRAAERLGRPRTGLVAGMIALWPMVSACSDSVSLQLSSAHYQERTHINAVVLTATTLATAVAFAGVVELTMRFRRGRE